MAEKRTNWSAAPILFVVAPTCPACGCAQYRTVRSVGNGDDSRTKFVICAECGTPYKISIEFPEVGNAVYPAERMAI